MNEVITQETNLPAAVSVQQFMADSGITASDIKIPKLCLMQPGSPDVAEEKAKFGDILHTGSMKAAGDFSKSAEIIPLKMYKTWRVYDVSGPVQKLISIIPLDSSNEKLPWEDNMEGTPIRRYNCFNVYCLLRSEVNAGEAFPIVVTFKSTSVDAGKDIVTHMMKMAMMSKPPYYRVINLGSKKEKNEKSNSYYAKFTASPGSNCTSEEMQAAVTILGMLPKDNAKVDEASEEKASTMQARPSVSEDDVGF